MTVNPRVLTSNHKKASEAQVKLLAVMWAEGKVIKIDMHRRYCTPTMLNLIKRRYIAPNGMVGKFPNDALFEEFEITEKGVTAVEVFLRDRRLGTE